MRVLALLITLFASMWPAPSTTTKAFTVSAHRFTFTITPSPFVVNQGDTVTLDMTATDVQHGFSLPEFGVDVVLTPGQHVTKTFVANMAGTFTYACTVVCGEGHGGMNGTFTVTAQAAAPTISDLTPVSGPTAGGTVVAINGTGFQNGATVMFGDTAAVSVTVNSTTSITTIAPAHAAGPVTITLANPDGQSATGSTYTYAEPVGRGKRRSVRQHG